MGAPLAGLHQHLPAGCPHRRAVVAKFKAAMAGKAGAWRAAADCDPLAMCGEEKQDGSFIVHQPGKKIEGRDVANTFDDPPYREWLFVDAAKSPGLRTYPWAAKWLSAFKARYITSQARTTDTIRQTRKDAFKDRNRQRADESGSGPFPPLSRGQ